MTTDSEESRDIHVIPVNDEREHVTTMSCPCNPRRDAMRRVVVHQAWDRREVLEEIEQALQISRPRDHFVPDESGGGTAFSGAARWAGRQPMRWLFIALVVTAVALLVMVGKGCA